MYFDLELHALVGAQGRLPVAPDDEISRKLAMLFEGECEGLGPSRAAEKFGYSKQRYFQLRDVYQQRGAAALASQRRGPKTHYRRTGELVRQVIRHRFLDPQASADVIAQKLRQTGFEVSTRSVERVIAEYGLQKSFATSRRAARPAAIGNSSSATASARPSGVTRDSSAPATARKSTL